MLFIEITFKVTTAEVQLVSEGNHNHQTVYCQQMCIGVSAAVLQACSTTRLVFSNFDTDVQYTNITILYLFYRLKFLSAISPFGLEFAGTQYSERKI